MENGLKKKYVIGLLWLLVLAVAAMIFFFSSQDGFLSAQTSGGFTDFLIRVFRPDYASLSKAERRAVYSQYQYIARKTGHLSEFALLGFSLRLLFDALALKRPKLYAWIAGTLYACTDELHQKLVGGRAGMWQDVCIDSAGVLLGVLFISLVLWLIRRRKEGKALPPPQG